MPVIVLIMDGILNINKPPGRTSFSIVVMVKRLTRERHAGHAGTLDPAATGVLPVCLGSATRLVEFLLEAKKTYRAEIELGVTTDTYDTQGRVIQRADISGISLTQIELALMPFRGLIQQMPPMYSAVKHQGKPLYELARAGLSIERKSRPANIYQLEILDWQKPLLTIEVVCSRGTYIRSLAHDLGQALGCGAALKGLARTRYSIFDIRDAISETQFLEACRYGYWQKFLYPLDSVLLDWESIIVNETTAQQIRNGCPVPLAGSASSDTGEDATSVEPTSPAVAGKRYRAYALDGRFLAILRLDTEKGQLLPEKVFIR